MMFSVELIEELEKLDPAVRAAFLKILKIIEQAIGEVVKREDFLELKKTVEIQSQNLKDLTSTVKELAEAQKRTEERLNLLATRVDELAEALKKLTDEHRKTREQVGGLSHTVGYVLENQAYKALPELLLKDFGVAVEGALIRDFIEISPNRYEEVNIFGRGRKNGTSILIIGEAKTQLKKIDIDSFLKKVARIEKVLKGEKILLLVTHQVAHPSVINYAQDKGITKIYFSYQF